MSAGAAAAASPARAQGATAPARPLSLPPRPRRVSGPARRRVLERPARGRSAEDAGIALRLLAALDGVSRHRLLRGRTWIGLVAFALIGIVTLQLGLLKLNAGIGHALEREAVLQRENAALSIENSEMATSGRVTSWAARLGMAAVPMGSLRFLAVHGATDASRGAAALSSTAHAPAAGSGEALGGSPSAPSSPASPASPASPEGTGTTTIPSSTQPTAGPTRAGESTATPSSSASSESSSAPSRERGSESAGVSTSAPAPAGAPEAGTGSAEGASAGGTRASPSG